MAEGRYLGWIFILSHYTQECLFHQRLSTFKLTFCDSHQQIRKNYQKMWFYLILPITKAVRLADGVRFF